MSVSYTRISNINEKVKDVSLTISQWRVLFAINENTYIEEIGDYVEESIDQIQDSIQALLDEGLLTSSEASSPDEPVQELSPEPEVEEVIEEVEEEIEIEESEPEIVFADEPEVEEVVEEVEEVEEEIIIEEDEDIEIDIEDDIEIEAEVEEEIEIEEEAPVEEIVEEITEAPVPEPEPEVKDEKASPAGGGKKIMVIDESIVIRKMVEIAFEDLEYNVIGYSSGEDALANVESENADLYLVDSALKDIKSVTLMNQLKDKKNSPVVMFCTKTNPQLAKEVEEAGCDGIVSKPFNDDDLINKIKELT